MAVDCTGMNGVMTSTNVVAASSDYSCCFQVYFHGWPPPAVSAYRVMMYYGDDPTTLYQDFVMLFQNAVDHADPCSVGFVVGIGGVATTWTYSHSLLQLLVGWTTVCYTRQGTTQWMYINGVTDVTGFEHSPGAPIDADDSFIIRDLSAGSFTHLYLGTDTFNGAGARNYIQNFREWSKAKTLNDLIAEGNSPSAIDTVGLTRDIPMATNLVDNSGNGNDFTAVGSISFRPGPTPVPVTNLADTTAAVIGSVPSEYIQMCHTVTAPHTYATVEPWWKYVGVNAGDVVNVFGYVNSCTTYWANGFGYTGSPGSLVQFAGGTGPVLIDNVPRLFGVQAAGTEFYFNYEKPADYAPALIVLYVKGAPAETVPNGSILIPNDIDTGLLPAAIVSATDDEVLGMKYRFSICESGDVLPGVLLCEHQDTSQLAIYNVANLVTPGSVPSPSIIVPPYPTTGSSRQYFIRTQNAQRLFYVANNHTDSLQTKLWTYDIFGTLGPQTWNPGRSDLTAIAVSNNGEVLYYCSLDDPATPTAIHRHNLVTDTAMADLVATRSVIAADYWVVADILVLADDSIVVAYSGGLNLNPDARAVVIRYDATGAVLNTYDYSNLWLSANNPELVGAPTRLAYALDDPVSFWVWLHEDWEEDLNADIRNVRASDGAVLTNRLVPNYQRGIRQGWLSFAEASTWGQPGYDDTVFQVNDDAYDAFGPAASCPLIVLNFAAPDVCIGLRGAPLIGA